MPVTMLNIRDTKKRKGDISHHEFLCWAFKHGHKHQPARCEVQENVVGREIGEIAYPTPIHDLF